jgi:hypothetical protein
MEILGGNDESANLQIGVVESKTPSVIPRKGNNPAAEKSSSVRLPSQ